MQKYFALIPLLAVPCFAVDDALSCTNAPKTQLEALACQTGIVLIKGLGDVGSVPVEHGTVTIYCLRYLAPDVHQGAAGLEVKVKLASGSCHAFIDYDEIDHLLAAINQLAHADKKINGLPSFEAVYKTRDELRLATFNIVDGLTESLAASISRPGFPTVPLTLNQLTQLAALIEQAKATLDGPGKKITTP
jgi:hypothetical protein